MDTSHLTEEHKKAHHFMRNTLFAIVAIGLSIVSYLAYTNPTLFQAAITGGASSTVTTDLYIPTDYKGAAGESDYIEVRVGKAMTKMEKLKVTLSAPTSQLVFASADTSQDLLKNESCTTIKDITQGEIVVDCGTFTTKLDALDNDVLFRVLVTLDSSLADGNTVVLTTEKGVGDSVIKEEADTADRIPTFTDGKITIGAVQTTPNLDCGTYGFKKDNACVCDPGYFGARCNVCDEASGYTGYPSCKKTALGNVASLVLTLNPESISKLTDAEKDQAYSSAYVFINSTTASGKKISLEGVDITIPVSSSGTTNAEKIDSITDNLKPLLEVIPAVNVSKVAGVSGLLKLEAASANLDSTLDPVTTTSGDVVIVPGMNYTIKLHPNSSYKLQILAKNSDAEASMLDLNYNNVQWKPQPMNRLSDTALKGGLLEKGDKSGLTPLYAQIAKSTGTSIDSNQLTVEVQSAPLIEYVRRIGTKLVERGGRVNLNIKVIDTEKINDIKDISSSVVRSTGATYAAINADTTAAWFTATPFKTEVKTSDSGTQTGSDGTTSENYKIYSIPVEIPQDANLTDGDYKLVIEITDTSGRVTAGILAVSIGSVASGDVNGDGKISMLDVITAFQISNGSLSNPTQAQLQAADLNNDGKVTMLDVISLFNKL